MSSNTIRCVVVGALAACAPLAASYDPFFDQSLNDLSEASAVFVSSAMTGGPERLPSSPESIEYFASSYNVIDRLSARARATRASVPCPEDGELATYYQLPFVTSELPDDYAQIDCREFQLYSVRVFLDQLKFGQQNDGILKPLEAKAYGGQLQVALLGAINTFLITRKVP